VRHRAERFRGPARRDLDRSQQFYTEVLGLIPLMDFGHARILFYRPAALALALLRHDGAVETPFTELNPGLDHLGFGVSSQDELVVWEQRFRDLGIEHTPIRDMEFGYHLNFRDPDHIALELSAPNDVLRQFYAELQRGDLSLDEIDARITEYLASLSG
jgi:catechol 2,3-dioxygenase-like lactoylglutathione lyase family enzyme